MAEDPLAKWRRPGSKPVDTGDSLAVAPLSGIRPREYRAFEQEKTRPMCLAFHPSLVRRPHAHIALPYAYFAGMTMDGYGFGFSITFAKPLPWGPVVVDVRGSGLNPLVNGILNGTVSSIQIFDPERHIPPNEGDFDIEADEWQGPCIVKEITFTTKNSSDESTTRH